MNSVSHFAFVSAVSGEIGAVRGACPHDCPDTCALVTTVQNGVALKVQGNPGHPATGGVLCAKVAKYAERTHHPERLLHPLKRVGPKGSGQFQRVGAGVIIFLAEQHDIGAQRCRTGGTARRLAAAWAASGRCATSGRRRSIP